MNKDLLNILSNSNKDIDNQQLMDYLSGNLSGEPMHEVERSMADNAFLNDAVEGLQQLHDRKDIQVYVEELNTALHNNMAKKKGTPAETPPQRYPLDLPGHSYGDPLLPAGILDHPYPFAQIISTAGFCFPPNYPIFD
jgi:hypothetical protein